MLKPFQVLEPPTISEASAELGRLGEQARVYAGGAELLLLLRNRILEADYLVNIKSIPGLGEISWDGDELRLGATVTHHALELDPVVRERFPMLAYAESQVGNIRVRNQGTLGGNLSFADPHSDPPTALLVYGASVTVAGKGGERQMPLEEFLVGTYETALEPDELLTEVRLRPLAMGWSGAYLRLERLPRPTLNVGVAARRDNGRLEDVRIVAGCVGPKAVRLAALEDKLKGSTIGEAVRAVEEADTYLIDRLQPVDDLLGSADYKLYMTKVFIGRALGQAFERGEGGSQGGFLA
jgi:carbon-monoxide dehydrogenase medium subunit